MKFSVSSTTLLNHLQAISKVIAGRPILPILENILFVVEDGVLTATASDREITMETKIALDSMEEPGRITVPSKILLDELREFPEQPIRFDINTQTNEVRFFGDKGNYVIQGDSAEDYPLPAPFDEEMEEFEVASGLIYDGINKSIFATADNDIRPVMSCILVEIGSEGYTFVASDAHKLVKYQRKDYVSDKGDFSFILPKKPAALLRSVLAKDDSPLKLSFGPKTASFVFANYRMTATLVEGRFPNYNSVIPHNNNRRLIVEKKELYGSLKRVAIVANQASNLVKFSIRDGEMKISAQNIDYAMSGQETISCQYNDEPLVIGFKSSFVLEILANIDTENVIVDFADSALPGLFMPEVDNTEEEEMLMLLMPMQLPEE